MVTPVVQERNTDAFGTLIADNTRNTLNIAAFHPQSPERLRLFKNGTRQFRQYNAISEYTHTDAHELTPSSGDTLTLASTERPVYVVAYEQQASFALSISQSLQTGDRVRVGYYTDNNGYLLEQTGADADDEATLIVRRNGSQETTTDVVLGKPLTDFTRMELRTNWYGVGNQRWVQTYTENGEQINEGIGTTSVDGSRGSQTAALPLRFEVTAGSGTSNLTLNAGSLALITQGNGTSIDRAKDTFNDHTLSQSGSWEPAIAYRVDPDRAEVTVKMAAFTIRETATNADTFGLFSVFDPSKVQDVNGNTLSDGNYTAPEEHSSINSAIQENTNVDQIADSSGTVSSSAADPGGYSLLASGLYTGTGQARVASDVDRGIVRRTLTERDVGVVLLKSGSTGDVEFDVRFQQNW